MKVGILYICLGKYDIFWKNFYNSSEKYFLPGIEKHYFVFTDADNIFEENSENVTKIFHENMGWPDNTLKRFDLFLNYKKLFLNFDYLVFFNANIEFAKNISFDNFFDKNKKFVAVQHPGFYNKNPKKFSLETRKESTAYSDYKKIKYYFQGALQGGKTIDFLNACQQMSENIDIDLKNNIIAIWHDESHWNRFLISKENETHILSPAYLYPKYWKLPFDKNVIMLDKSEFFNISTVRNGNFFQNFRDSLYRFLKRKGIL